MYKHLDKQWLQNSSADYSVDVEVASSMDKHLDEQCLQNSPADYSVDITAAQPPSRLVSCLSRSVSVERVTFNDIAES